MKKISFWTRSLLLLCFIVFCSSNGWAWSDFALIGNFSGSTWTPIYLTKVNDNHFTGTIDASSWENNRTYEFKFYNQENLGATENYWGSVTWNIDFTSNSTYTIDEGNNSDNMTFKHNSAYSSYTVDAEYITDYWHVTITGVSSGPKYQINITNGTGGTVSPSGSQQVGATGINVTATPNAGYKFTNWTATGGAHVESLTSATTKLIADADGSLRANFDEVTPLTIYLQNDGNWTTPITAYVYKEESGSTIENAVWSGVTMTSLGNGRFSYTITNEALFDGRVIFVGAGSRYPDDGQPGLEIDNKSKVFNTSGNTWGLAGPTVTFTPAAGSYTDAMSLQVTLSGEADSKTYTCIVTKDAGQVALESFQMSTATVTKAVYDANSDGVYVVTVKDAENNVLARATYTIAIETKYVVNVSAGANGNVSPSGDINVGKTPVAISANADHGYQFKQWTTTGGVTVTNAVSANTTIRATSAGTVKAIFEEYTAPDMSYYLVGNFFEDDLANKINYNRRYFKFNIQSDGRYMVEIPAAVTARAQIIGVTDVVTKFGPSSSSYNINATHPTTDLTVSGSFGTTNTDNYWNLTTRNNSNKDTEGGEDDGLYEVWFELDESGNPSQWSFKHVSTKRVAYFLSTAPDATANPVYNSRNEVSAGFSNRTYAMVYIDPTQSYYIIGYVLRGFESDYTNKATAYGAHVNQRGESILPTTNKLFLMGNNGRTFKTQNPYNEVSPHVAAIKVNDKQAGLYKVEYNPSNGNNEWAKGIGNGQPDNEKNTVGIRGQFMFISDTSYDSPISSISMVGNAIPGTTNGDGTWDWASTAGDMTYDENEGCYKLTIQTTASESEVNRFRFVANHNQNMTWYEDGTEDAKKARVPYLEDGDGHSCLPTDPNPVSYTVIDNTANTDVNIIFNRPAGTWTVRFYIDISEQGQKSYRYTITGTESFDIPLTYCCDKFIRTYSNNIAMDLTSGVKAYIAYTFEQPQNPKDNYAACKVYLRQMDYIPANVGVVLVGQVPDGHTYNERDQLNFSLQKRVEAVPEDLREVWTKHVDYINAEDEWHNFLVPTVTAVNNLGNAMVNSNGNIIYRYFVLNNYHSTAYYKSTGEGDDYIGFFRLTERGKSGANKAYLSIPSSAVVGTEGETVTQKDLETYGCLNFNAQLSGQETDEAGHPSLAKAMVLFDDENFDDNISTGITTIKDNIVKDNVYYNLQGLRVATPSRGMYIFNGKKILVK